MSRHGSTNYTRVHQTESIKRRISHFPQLWQFGGSQTNSHQKCLVSHRDHWTPALIFSEFPYNVEPRHNGIPKLTEFTVSLFFSYSFRRTSSICFACFWPLQRGIKFGNFVYKICYSYFDWITWCRILGYTFRRFFFGSRFAFLRLVAPSLFLEVHLAMFSLFIAQFVYLP